MTRRLSTGFFLQQTHSIMHPENIFTDEAKKCQNKTVDIIGFPKILWITQSITMAIVFSWWEKEIGAIFYTLIFSYLLAFAGSP